MDRLDPSCVAPRTASSAPDREWRASVDALVSVADAAFGPARLVRQRAAIDRRVAQRSRGAHARILRFPGAVVRTAAAHPWRRWVAAAAVAGLLAGAGAGRFLFPDPRPTSSLASTAPTGRVTPAQFRMSPGDEAFLIEFDAALSGRPGAPLRALDALTPDGH